jgi:hypothetical protein
VKDTHSYIYFLQKSQELRERKSFEKIRLDKKPGSGKLWNYSTTIPQSFEFKTESRSNTKHKRSQSGKSLDFSTLNSNIINTTTYATNQSQDIISKKENRIKSVKISVTYNHAVNHLHKILHRINL